MKIYIIFLFLLGVVEGSEDCKKALEVGELSLDGNRMMLRDNLQWEHSFGIIKAKSAEAYFDNLNPLKAQEITMQEGVEILLKDGGIITSPYAWLECRQMIGVFHGHEGNKIGYENKSRSISLKSLRMELKFASSNKNDSLQLEQLIADGDVEIGFKPDVTLLGARAIFSDISQNRTFCKATLTRDEVNPCIMIQSLPDGLENKIIFKDALFLNKQAELDDPKGLLQRKGTPLNFQAKKMFIDRKEGTIVLKPPVQIHWIGVLESSGHVEIQEKNKMLHSLHIQGPASLFWRNSSDGREHRLKVPGTMKIKTDQNTIELLSQSSAQNVFSDSFGEIYSDKILLIYKDELRHLEPLSIHFEGNVRLQNNMEGMRQYALADEASFSFGSNTLTLQSKVRPRVLFYDELNKIEASAPILVINRNPKTGKDTVRGIGNVRFVFAEEELNEIKKRFFFETRK